LQIVESLRQARLPYSVNFSNSLLRDKKALLGLISSRENISAVCFALALSFAMMDKPILSTPFFYYLVFLGFGIRLAPIELRWTTEVVLCLVIGISGFVAIAVSPLVGRNIFATSFLTAATVLLIPLLFVKNIDKIFYAMIPVCYVQALFMIWQWFTEPLGHRASGFALNANAGSTVLLLGAIFISTNPKLRWLAVPLVVAIPFSGSRWVLIVGTLVFGLMFLSKHVKWRYILVGIMVSFAVLFGFQHDQIRAVYRATQSPIGTVEAGEAHAKYRLAAPVPITAALLIPQGFIDSNLHNVPLRMSVETGLLSGLAWLAVGAMVLYRRPRYDYAWWMMLAVCLLSIMYYHTWIGPTGVFWWLLVSKLMSNTLDNPKQALRRFWSDLAGHAKEKAP
jgi:hypothetical protein